MANVTALRGACVAPFFQESQFPTTGGFVLGRYCAPVPGAVEQVSCCLPCPATDWVYPNNFLGLTRMAGWVNVGGLVLTVSILLSFIFLPKERTKRQYLNVCLILGIILMEVGFIVPLGARPQQCYNEITPNDMSSSMTCAWSGALIVAGGVSITMWILIRTLSMHLQICWDITPGTRFFYTAQLLGWAGSAGLVAAALVVSGVSFRFGDACHINHRNSLQSLWGPLMGVAGVSFILQIATFIYCMNVYLRNLRYDSKPGTDNSGGQQSSAQRNPKARAVYKRVTKVLALQWRGLLICFIMLVDVAFFSVVFVYFDTRTQEALSNFAELLPWLVCLITSVQDGAGKDKCLGIVSQIVVSETIVIATLMLLSIIGVQALLLVGRWGMVTGWIELLRARFGSQREFVSLDAHTRPSAPDMRTYELLRVDTPATVTTFSPDASSIKSPPSAFHSPLDRTDAGESFGKEIESAMHLGRSYQSPRMSFSSPRPPGSAGRGMQMEYDLSSRFAKSGLGLERAVEEDNDMHGWV